jgi:dihydroorotate dehydrogenase (NAD+) catalytic subunit
MEIAGMDLSVDLADVRLENPVLLASGTAGYGSELSSVMDLAAVGGLILKSVTEKPRRGNPGPRIWETGCGMLNSIGLENMGVDALLEEVLPSLAESGVTVIASIAGDTIDEYGRLAERLDGAPGVSAIEVNVSCPNVDRGGINFGTEAGATLAVSAAVQRNSGLPFFVKLSAAVSDLAQVALAARSGGASGLSLINTIPGLAVETVTRRPRLEAVTGGLSGPAIKPVALKAVWDCYSATGLPIIGCGGVYDVDDVCEFLVAGATAVAVGTATFQDPARALEIIEALPGALSALGVESPRELTGSMRA